MAIHGHDAVAERDSVATLELKNAMTGQTWRHAYQYKHDRDANDLIFSSRSGRCAFAVDTDEAYMTTRLRAEDALLPLNRGRRRRWESENPGHKTAYLWESLLERHSFLILGRFIHLQVGRRSWAKKVKRET